MGKRVAILQSNYIPWKGYFDIISDVEEFIFYDEVQYTKNDWRNRNKIKTQAGPAWITIPVRHEHLDQRILDTKIVLPNWSEKHWKTISLTYAKAAYFKMFKDAFKEFYLSPALSPYLSEINIGAIRLINSLIGIKTKLSASTDYVLPEGKTERLVSLCKQAGASVYLSGPAAKDYLQEDLFEKENIRVEWKDYRGYREYPQAFPPFTHAVSVLDLMFNTGPEALSFITEKEKQQTGI